MAAINMIGKICQNRFHLCLASFRGLCPAQVPPVKRLHLSGMLSAGLATGRSGVGLIRVKASAGGHGGEGIAFACHGANQAWRDGRRKSGRA